MKFFLQKVFLLIFCLVGAQLISLFALTTGRLGPEWPVIEWVSASDDDNTGPVSLCHDVTVITLTTRATAALGSPIATGKAGEGEGCWLGKVAHWATFNSIWFYFCARCGFKDRCKSFMKYSLSSIFCVVSSELRQTLICSFEILDK